MARVQAAVCLLPVAVYIGLLVWHWIDTRRHQREMDRMQAEIEKYAMDLSAIPQPTPLRLPPPEPVALPTTNDVPFATLVKLESVREKYQLRREEVAQHLNAERDRLKEKFPALLLEFVHGNEDRCFRYSTLVSSEPYVDGREPMPKLSLQLLNEGIRTCIGKNTVEPDLDCRASLMTMSVCAAGESQLLGREEEAIAHKRRAETMVAKEPILNGCWPARTKEEIAAYDAIPVPRGEGSGSWDALLKAAREAEEKDK